MADCKVVLELGRMGGEAAGQGAGRNASPW